MSEAWGDDMRDDAEWILDVKILDPLARRFAIARRITKAADRIEALEARIAELEDVIRDMDEESAWQSGINWSRPLAARVEAALIPNPRRSDSEMAGTSGNLSDLTGG